MGHPPPTGTDTFEVTGTTAKSAGGSHWATLSDRRIKTGISAIENALDVIRRLRPVRYFYSEQFRAGRKGFPDYEQYGFIAQKFSRVFPNSVKQTTDGFFQMNDSNVLPYTVKSIQELIGVIDDQQRQIDELRALVNQLLDERERPRDRRRPRGQSPN